MEPDYSIDTHVDVFTATIAKLLILPIYGAPSSICEVTMPNPLWLISLYLFAPAPYQNFTHGTALVIARTNEEIVVAADSRVTDKNGRAMPDTCKIRRSGGLYFSMNGMTSSGGVDFAQLVDKFLGRSGTLANRVESIRHAMVPILNRALQSDIEARRISAAQDAVTGVSVYGFDHGILEVDYIRFALKDPTHVEPEVHKCPGVDCPPDGRVVMTVPHGGGFDSSISAITAARQWVQTEIDKGVFDIGGPIQLMSIDKNGKSHWVEQPQVCKDQNSSRKERRQSWHRLALQ